MNNDSEIRQRLWYVLSELYLDNELTHQDICRIADVCAKSPYSLGELDRIMFMELYPALMGNIFSLASRWAPFEETWLYDRIVCVPKPRAYIPWWMDPIKQIFLGRKWRDLKQQIKKNRRDNNLAC